MAVVASPSDRTAMRHVLADAGYGRALDSIKDAFVVALVPDTAPGADEMMEALAASAEDAVLDALVVLAREQGWRSV